MSYKVRICDFPLVADIKNNYRLMRENGKSRGDAVEQLLVEYRDEITIGAFDDGLLFWIGLAEGQWFAKELETDVAQKALEALDKLQTIADIAPLDIAKRKNNYSQAPMAERKIIKRRKFQCAWNIGDTFSVQLRGKLAEEQRLCGKYALFQKVDSIALEDGSILPLMRVSLWNADELPPTKDVFYSRRPLRLRGAYLIGDSLKYQYRLQILFSNQKQVNESGFQFVGNYPDIEILDDELILTRPGDIVMDFPKDIIDRCSIYYQRDKLGQGDGSVSSSG